MTPQQTAVYQAALRAARAAFDASSKRLAAATEEIAALEDELTRLRQTITALSSMCSEDPALDSLGITSSITRIMDSATTSLTTADVVRALYNVGFDVSVHKNAAASVHAILNRLSLADKITKVQEGNKISWRGPKYNVEDDIPF